MQKPVSLNVPMPLHDTDAELNLLAMLTFVIEHQRKILTDAEIIRSVRWIFERYQCGADGIQGHGGAE